MGGRSLALPLLAAALAVSACSDRQNDAPTSPEFAARGSCSLSNVSQLVKNEFGNNSPEAGFATDMKSAGAQTDQATFDGYQILASIGTKYQPGTATSTSNAAAVGVALFPCIKLGTSPTLPSATDLEQALGANGAFAVRGLANPDATGVVSHDGEWVLEPPSGGSWQSLLGDGLGVSTDPRIQYAFLAFGLPKGTPDFTHDEPVSGIFDWSTLPAATFTGDGVVVGECTHPSNYLQHNPANQGAEVLGFLKPSCYQVIASIREAEPRTFADRILRFFGPAPAFAALATTTTTGSGGSKKTLSPFQLIFPNNVVLVPHFSWSKSGNKVNVPFSPPPNYTIQSSGGTPFLQEKVLIWLEATNNQGTKVLVCNNYAYTNKNGVAAFTSAFLNKAGGYTITTRSAGASANNVAGDLPTVPPSDPLNSPLINVKNNSGNPSCGTPFVPIFDQDGAVTNPPPYPGPNPAP
jgi:hypothetical protein